MDIFTPFDSPLMDVVWLGSVTPLIVGVVSVIAWAVLDSVRYRKHDAAEAKIAEVAK